uniref:Uncharacterized protein n=1 Tax=Ciona savignyi TaxID=51511 RepID=H2YED6_CIOSA
MCFKHRARYRGSLNCGSRARRKIGFVSAWTTFPPFLLLLVVSFAMCTGHGINTSRVAVEVATGTRYLCVKEEMIGPNRTNVLYIVKTCRNASLGRPNIYSEFKVNPASSGRGVVLSFTLPSGSHRFIAW